MGGLRAEGFSRLSKTTTGSVKPLFVYRKGKLRFELRDQISVIAVETRVRSAPITVTRKQVTLGNGTLSGWTRPG